MNYVVYAAAPIPEPPLPPGVYLRSMKSARSSQPALCRGEHEAPVAQLSRFLREAAQHHARRALTCPERPSEFELLDAAISVGAAVELLAKALVATVHPALLVKDGAPHGILRLTQGRGVGSRKPFDFQTLDAKVAVSLARELNLGLQVSDVRTSLEVRNAAAHFAIVQDEEFRIAVGEMSAYANKSLALLGLSKREFWGDQDSAAALAVELREIRAREAYEERVRDARKRYASGFGMLQDAEQRDLLVNQLLNTHEPEADDVVEIECPACENYINVGIMEEYDVVREADGYEEIPLGRSLMEFECPVCGLEMDNGDIERAGHSVHELLGYEEFGH